MTRNNNDNTVSINYKESLEFLDRCKKYKYVMPKNVIINITFKLDLYETPAYYDDLSKKQKKLLIRLIRFIYNMLKTT